MEEALAYAEIAAAVEDPISSVQALSALQRTMFRVTGPAMGESEADDARIVDVLIKTSRNADERVRLQALSSLSLFTLVSEDPTARATLESVITNEPELAAQLNIAGWLESADRRARSR